MIEEVITSIVTELIKALIPALIKIIRTAKQGRKEWQRLKDKLESIQPCVEQIEEQLRKLQRHDPDAEHNLKMVEKWLRELKEALEVATDEVHKFNTTSKFKRWFNYQLSESFIAQNNKITELAGDRLNISLHLSGMLMQVEHAHAREEWPGWIEWALQGWRHLLS
ncbi:hypothetical protein M758_3G170200 [Ceratodon purpureus]|nr:hypothetical protein M758_3G170200 [Ceratodon purpureus]